LAQRMIELSGKSLNEIPIEFVGMRPGEKLFEELLCDTETCLPTPFRQIRIFGENGNGNENIVDKLDSIIEILAQPVQSEEVRMMLSRVVSEYNGVNG